MFYSFRLVATAAMLFTASLANATLIDFESGLDPYFSTTGVMAHGRVELGSGYDNVLDYTSSDRMVLNPGAVSSASFNLAGPGTFDLTSFVVAGAWGSQTLGVEGLLNGVVSYTQYLAVTTTAQLISLDWMGIDGLRIRTDSNGYSDTTPNSGSGQHWVIDNIRVNESVAVSGPGGLVLLLAGMAALSTRQRKHTPVIK